MKELENKTGIRNKEELARVDQVIQGNFNALETLNKSESTSFSIFQRVKASITGTFLGFSIGLALAIFIGWANGIAYETAMVPGQGHEATLLGRKMDLYSIITFQTVIICLSTFIGHILKKGKKVSTRGSYIVIANVSDEIDSKVEGADIFNGLSEDLMKAIHKRREFLLAKKRKSMNRYANGEGGEMMRTEDEKFINNSLYNQEDFAIYNIDELLDLYENVDSNSALIGVSADSKKIIIDNNVLDRSVSMLEPYGDRYDVALLKRETSEFIYSSVLALDGEAGKLENKIARIFIESVRALQIGYILAVVFTIFFGVGLYTLGLVSLVWAALLAIVVSLNHFKIYSKMLKSKDIKDLKLYKAKNGKDINTNVFIQKFMLKRLITQIVSAIIPFIPLATIFIISLFK